MSAVRDAIAEALNGAGVGVNATPGRPDTLQPMSAWPQWVRDVPLTMCSVERSFWVLIVLPAGAVSVTEDAAEELRNPLMGALLDLGNVTAVEPVNLTAQPESNPQSVPALRFSLTLAE